MRRIRRGSSASASCSAKSPVSVQSEKFDPTEWAEEIDERRLPFSLADSNTRAERFWDSDRKDRKGIFGDLCGDDVVEGMMAVGGLMLTALSLVGNREVEVSWGIDNL